MSKGRRDDTTRVSMRGQPPPLRHRPTRMVGTRLPGPTLCAAAFTAGAAVFASAAFAAAETARLDATAISVPTAIRLNGTLRDEVWDTASSVSDFLQREPHEG